MYIGTSKLFVPYQLILQNFILIIHTTQDLADNPNLPLMKFLQEKLKPLNVVFSVCFLDKCACLFCSKISKSSLAFVPFSSLPSHLLFLFCWCCFLIQK